MDRDPSGEVTLGDNGTAGGDRAPGPLEVDAGRVWREFPAGRILQGDEGLASEVEDELIREVEDAGTVTLTNTAGITCSQRVELREGLRALAPGVDVSEEGCSSGNEDRS